MRIRIKFFLSSGATIEDETSDFDSIAECGEELSKGIGQPTGTLVWYGAAGDRHIFANAHIAAAHLTPAEPGTAETGATA